MKTLFFISLLIFPVMVNAQKTVTDPILDKWNKATVPICGLKSNEIPTKETRELVDLYLQQKITPEQYAIAVERLETSQSYGTATFLKYKEKHYLITARHVLIDNSSAMSVFSNILIMDRVGEINYKNVTVTKYADGGTASSFSREYFNRIEFGVPNKLQCFILSTEDEDVGIIDLEDVDIDHNIIRGLYKRGYVPISITDIDTNCKIKNESDIFTIGFPGEGYSTRQLPPILSKEMPYAQSRTFVTKGVIKDVKKDNIYFLAGIWANHGNSGGAVIHNNRMVGIIHGPDAVMINPHLTPVNQYVDFNVKIMKSSLIMPLLLKLESGIPNEFFEHN